MPGEDGTSLARRIRASEPPGAPPTPLIALTAFTLPHERSRVMEAGFNVHVGKPFDIDALLDNVRALVPKK
jgi:CheY-like chemotaxis protein